MPGRTPASQSGGVSSVALEVVMVSTSFPPCSHGLDNKV